MTPARPRSTAPEPARNSLRRLVSRVARPVRAALGEPSSQPSRQPAGTPEPPRPVLSVVVVATDAAGYLDECLDALAAQTLTDLEVIVVDHRSTDDTVAIVRRRSEGDQRFRVIDGPGGTRPAARNAGERQARGEFLAFLDATDVLLPGAYAELVKLLRGSRSDVAAGGWQELRLGRPRRPSWVLATHDLDRPARRLADFPEAVLDLGLGNRVFRTDFWRTRVIGFSEHTAAGFPEAVDGTESYAIAAASLAAETFDFAKRVVGVHHPRLGPAALTRGPAEVDALDATLTWLERTYQLVRDHAAPEVAGRALAQVIDTQLADLAAAAPLAGPDYRARLQASAARLLTEADRLTWPYVRVECKLQFWHAAHGQWDDLALAAEHFRLNRPLPDTELVADSPGSVPRIRIIGLPEPGPDSLGPPDTCRELADHESVLTTCIERLVWDGPVLRIEGWAYVLGLDLAGRDGVPSGLEIRARLTEITTRVERPVTVEPVRRDAADVWSKLKFHDVAPGGFTLTVDTTDLPLESGRWQLGLTFEAFGLSRQGPLLTTLATGAAGRGAARPVLGDTEPSRVVAQLDREHGFVLHVRPEPVRVDDLTSRTDADHHHLTGRMSVLGGRSVTLVTVVASDPDGHEVSADCDASGRVGLRLPRADSATTWQLRAVDERGRRLRILGPADGSAPGPWTRSARGLVELVTGPVAAVLAVSVEDGTLRLDVAGEGIDWTGTRMVGTQLEVPAEIEAVDGDAGPGRAVLRFPLRVSRFGGPVLPLPGDQCRVLTADGVRLTAGSTLLASLPVHLLTEDHRIDLGRDGETGLMISVDGPRSLAQEGRYGRFSAARIYARREPAPRDAVFFQCYRGEFATDSQRAIHEELRRRGSDLELLWGVQDLSVPLPEGGRPLLIETQPWFDALADSRYLCGNSELDRYFIPRPHQRYLQTFHGYPFKSMGASLWRAQGRAEVVIAAEQRRRDAAWDSILVPADFCTDLYRDEYAYRGEVLVTGYPRDDALVGDDAGAARERVLTALGIPLDKTVVLYAPTWRDTVATGAWTAKFFDELDVEALAGALGDDYVILLRGHNFNLREGLELRIPGAYDVSSYPEVNDLILAADVAILDYSSMRFDWMITGKPVLFFVPDLDDYLQSRTVLFDFRPTAPGPLLETTEQVAEALLGLSRVSADYADERKSFNLRYNQLHDGQAAKRVVDAFFR